MEHRALVETISRLIMSGLDELEAITLVAELFGEFIPEEELMEAIERAGSEKRWS